MPGVEVSNLSASAIENFRKRAAKAKRLSPEALEIDDAALVDMLRFTEGSYLKRAALLLFHSDPERFFTGASVKIGYFESGVDLRYHDEVHGSLFIQVDRTIDLLLTKYFKAGISYQGVQRVETFPVPPAALRDVVLNAIVHRDYAVGAPIQIRVYPDRMDIWNPGQLPDEWSRDKLMHPHPSRPFNPDVANAFFRAGDIEAWGRGIQRVLDTCRAAEMPEPELTVGSGDFWFAFRFSTSYLDTVSVARPNSGEGKTPVETPVETRVKTADRVFAELSDNPNLTLAEVAGRIGKSISAVERASAKLVKEGRLRRIGPRKGGVWEIPGDK